MVLFAPRQEFLAEKPQSAPNGRPNSVLPMTLPAHTFSAIAVLTLAAVMLGASAGGSAARDDFAQLRSSLHDLFAPPRRAKRAKSKSAERPSSTARAVPQPRPRPPDAPSRSERRAKVTPSRAAAPRSPPPDAQRHGERTAAVPPPSRDSTDRPEPSEEAATPAAPPAPSACQLRLTPDLAAVHVLAPITAGQCAVEDIVRLDAVMAKDGRRVAVNPPATLRCPMAESVIQWIRDDLASAARELGAPLKAVSVDTSFECRSRNRVAGAKLSEHGHANAIDVRAFTLADGTVVGLTDTAVDRGVRERLRQGSCARFTTVLGPGSDGYHESHVHLDLAERRGGYRMCQWDVRDPTVAASVPLPPERPASAPLRPAGRAPSAAPR
jgi:hypothetical protein